MNDDELDVSTLTLTDAAALLDRDATRLDIAERALTDARRAYEAHVVNGTHADTAEVRERLESQYGGALRKAEADAEAMAAKVTERARGVAAASQTGRPALSAGEMVEAGAFAPYAEADCRDLPIRDLVTTVRAAVVAGDRPRMFAYGRFLPKRLAPVAGESSSGQPDPAARDKNELRRLLGVITERLADPAFAPVNRKANDVLDRAGRVGREAGKRAREEYRQRHPFAFQTGNDVRWNRD